MVRAFPLFRNALPGLHAPVAPAVVLVLAAVVEILTHLSLPARAPARALARLDAALDLP